MKKQDNGNIQRLINSQNKQNRETERKKQGEIHRGIERDMQNRIQGRERNGETQEIRKIQNSKGGRENMACWQQDILQKNKFIGDGLFTGDVPFTVEGQVRNDRDAWVRDDGEVRVRDSRNIHFELSVKWSLFYSSFFSLIC